MPKNASLFGKYLRLAGPMHRATFSVKQITKPIPVKAYGRPPSASSQTGLYHDEDFNFISKTSMSLTQVRRKLKPHVFKKDFKSELLNTKIPNIRVTTSALHAMDDMGGFDNYILRTPPQEMRSHMGERMRRVAYFYMENPEMKEWALPWKVFLREKDRADPYFARHLHLMRKERNERMQTEHHAKYSPFYLPGETNFHPERQPFIEGSVEPAPINMWWKASPELEAAFRRRLGEAKSFDRAYADHKEPGAFKPGWNLGGGGKSGKRNPALWRNKTYNNHVNRAY